MNNNCITNLLKLIYLLQNNSITNLENTNCSKPCLGNILDSFYNTRPINIYTKNGSLFTTNYNNIDISVFRVENIENNYVKLIPLINNEGTFETTNTSITINTNSIYAIKCLEDIYINNL